MRILIVDDEKLVRSALKRVFRKCNYEIAEALDGLEALQKLESDFFDLLITDNDMPNKKGIELIQDILEGKTAIKNPAHAIILFSGKGRPENLPPEIEFMEKPWEDEKLRQRVKEIEMQLEAQK